MESIAAYSKPCHTCHKPESLPIYSSYKNCADCRAKQRKKGQLAAERKKLRLKQMEERMMDQGEGTKTKLNHNPSGDTTDSSDEMEEVSRSLGLEFKKTSTGATKRKAPKLLADMDGEEHRTALKVMKNGLLNVVKDSNHLPSNVSSSKDGKEYQTATLLYDSLKKCVTKSPSGSSLLQYHGFHSIVAVSTIDNQKRVELVAKDIRKIARVSFQHTKPESSCDFKTMGRSLTYKCTCLGYEPIATSTPTISAPVKMKGTAGDLIRQARARASLGGSDTLSIPRFCGGTVKITAVDDMRHPLGIPGQRITVLIQHP